MPGSQGEFTVEADVRAPAEVVFDTLVDLRGQDAWLGRSSAFRGTRDVSDHPVVVGTTYREPSPLGTRVGRVAELDRPRRVVFDQPMRMRFGLGTLGIRVEVDLAERDGQTHVTRHVTLSFPRGLGFTKPAAVGLSRAESRRAVRALKAACDDGVARRRAA
ncbi:SRPBCC domain-containing protein [Conexibacter sp. SYSU D00693]|uniref:SRPBCC family protein n=1 Tax=Conexibacter sp. SYSU D00693 TaxID=2812560 RepID=UPI00196B8C8C|nr:SRPBCC domain-containing protein [Conexibacter sp. SYSU D00693]